MGRLGWALCVPSTISATPVSIWPQGATRFRASPRRDNRSGPTATAIPPTATIWPLVAKTFLSNDVAARMNWTITPFAEATIRIVLVTGQGGTARYFVRALIGQPVVLDVQSSPTIPMGQHCATPVSMTGRPGGGDGLGSRRGMNIVDAESPR